MDTLPTRDIEKKKIAVTNIEQFDSIIIFNIFENEFHFFPLKVSELAYS